MFKKLPWEAAAYDCVSTVQQGWGRRVLAGLALRGYETVVDAGCGTGRLAMLLAEALPRGRVLAVDTSAEMLSVAGRNFLGLGNAWLLRADLAALPLAGAVDVIFSNATFHWVTDHDSLFGSLAGALKPGGTLAAQCGGAGNLERAHSIELKVAAAPRFARYFGAWREPYHFATPEETRGRLAAAGFTDIEVSLVAAPTPFPSRQALGISWPPWCCARSWRPCRRRTARPLWNPL